MVTFIRKCGNVENLGLSWNDLENDSLAGLMSLDHFMNDAGVCKVAFLDLRNCNLSLNSKDLLASIVKSPSLRYLDLSWNNFNDSIVPDILRSVAQRMQPLQLKLKGNGLTAVGLSQISQALTNLGTRFPSVAAIRLASYDILTDVDGKNRLALDNIYNNERLQKMSHEQGRVVLSPDTAELELLMSEMFKKKILAKDRLLRDLDDKIRYMQTVDLEVQQLSVKRDQASNDNSTLRRELENLKTLYSKTKQSSQIETESMTSQLKSMQASNNKREIDHRSLVDRLLSEQKTAVRNFGNELQDKDDYLTEKIRGIGMDKDRLDKEITNLKEKSVAFMASFNSEVRRRQEQARLEETARADWTH